ncbi:MAG: PPOX class F420-dependent oxidoreductase [Thermomicrobiales bacterium]
MTITPEVRSFLEERRFAVLATSFPDGRIQQTVMWYALRDDQIIMNTARGRVKDQNVRANPQVSLCWEEEYKFVSVNGTVSEIIDDQEQALEDIFAIARRYNPGATDEEIDERFSNFRQEERTTLVVSIDSMITNGF